MCGASVRRDGMGNPSPARDRPPERPRDGTGDPEPAYQLAPPQDAPYPHWFILSRGVPAATSSGSSRGIMTAAASAAMVTGMLL